MTIRCGSLFFAFVLFAGFTCGMEQTIEKADSNQNILENLIQEDLSLEEKKVSQEIESLWTDKKDGRILGYKVVSDVIELFLNIPSDKKNSIELQILKIARLLEFTKNIKHNFFEKFSGDLSLNNNGNLLVTNGESYSSCYAMWKLTDLKCEQINKQHSSGKAVVFSPVDKNIYSFIEFSVIPSHPNADVMTVLDISTNKIILKQEIPFLVTNRPSTVFTPDGKLLISSYNDNSIAIWDIYNNKLLKAIKVIKSNGYQGLCLRSIAISPDGNTIATGGEDKVIRLWDIHNYELKAVLHGHSHFIFSIVFSKDGKKLISGSKEIIVFDLETCKPIIRIDENIGYVRSMAISPDSTFLAVAHFDYFRQNAGFLDIYHIQTFQFIKRIQKDEHGINSVAFSPAGNLFVSNSSEGITLWSYFTIDEESKTWSRELNKSSDGIKQYVLFNEIVKHHDAYNKPFIIKGTQVKALFAQFPSLVQKILKSKKIVEIIEKEDKTEQNECVICCDTIQKNEQIATQCGHNTFHLHCIEQWKEQQSAHKTTDFKPNCPICRQPLVLLGINNLESKSELVVKNEITNKGPLIADLD